MAEKPQLRLINVETGELVTEDERDTLIEQQAADLKGKNLAIGKLKRELRELRAVEPEAIAVREVLNYWRRRCQPTATIAPGGKRWEKVRARLRDNLEERDSWSVKELFLAVDGALLDPWLNGRARDSKGYLGAETIFRDAEQVEKLRDIAIGFEAKTGAELAQLLDVMEEWGTVNWRHLLRICECGHRRVEHSRADPNRDGCEPCFFCECQDFDADPFEPFNLK